MSTETLLPMDLLTLLPMDLLISRFVNIGLDEKKAEETSKNKKLSSLLNLIIEKTDTLDGVEKSKGSLFYFLASTCNKDNEMHLPYIANAIKLGHLTQDAQVSAALKFVCKQETFTDSDFNKACGVGVVVPQSAIECAVNSVVDANRISLLEEKYAFNIGKLLRDIKLRPDMTWAEGKLIKSILDDKLLSLLGPKTEENSKPKKKEVISKDEPTVANSPRLFEGEVLRFHKPGENPQISEKIRQEHLEATGGKVVTRFPPEPNGYLHIGHAKAINFNFKYAEANNGITYLRFDDTNPEAEETEYYDSISESVSWLGYTPYKVTNSSDYFQELHDYAVRLIEKGCAYVCHQTPEEIELSRGGKDRKGPRTESPWRNRPISESLQLFSDMKAGKFKEGEATLRLKQDLSSGNPFMWDLVAYRVLYTPHCKTGSTWCVYPMYDFTHCLCDSIENITHSLCTTEFILAREAYYWVCDNAGVYKPVQWEYGRLSITNTILSKRKITKLVENGIVQGWDDPRLYTLAGLRRRGVPPTAINRFVEKLGITTAASTIDARLLESTVRDELNVSVPRRMAVLDPLLIILEDMDENEIQEILIPDLPGDANSAEHSVPFTNRIYIDSSDFLMNDLEGNFHRLTSSQPVGLYKACSIQVTSVTCDPVSGAPNMIRARRLPSDAAPPRAFIQWVADCPSLNSPFYAEVRLYENLFLSEDPENVSGGFLCDINPNSLRVIPKALLDVRCASAKPESRFQFQRIGYFYADPVKCEKGSGMLTFNKTVSLREDPNKPF